MNHERQIVLDTETTGLEHAQGHRIIEIGAVELLRRRLTERRFHVYINPDRPVDAEAVNVHGLDDAFLADKPRFAEIAEAFIEFVSGAELIIHNAAFDIGFIDAELGRLKGPPRSINDCCSVLDTLQLARSRHPGQRNNLDALCKRYGIDNSQRTLHGALLDAEILADVYLAMTGGQVALALEGEPRANDGPQLAVIRRPTTERRPPVVSACEEERRAHKAFLAMLEKQGGALWQARDEEANPSLPLVL